MDFNLSNIWCFSEFRGKFLIFIWKWFEVFFA